jgi:hypothetical protein
MRLYTARPKLLAEGPKRSSEKIIPLRHKRTNKTLN